MNDLKRRWLRPSVFVAACAMMMCWACKEDNFIPDEKPDPTDTTVVPPPISTYKVNILLAYPEGFTAKEGIPVTLKNSTSGTIAEAATIADGTVQFVVVKGIYEAVASETRSDEFFNYIFNGVISRIVVDDKYDEAQTPLALTLTTVAKEVEGDPNPIGRVVIKELYNGGCPKDDGSGSYQFDKYVILYNNSNGTAQLKDLTLAIVNPYNSQASNYDYVDGKLFYEAEGWLPAGQGYWTFLDSASLNPGEQIVIALTGAIDNTVTYSQSINFANPNYYCTYDIAVFPNLSYYPAPSEVIPTSHWLKGYLFGAGNAWTLSVTSPGFFLFVPQGITSEGIAADPSYSNYMNNNQTAANHRKKISTGWVVDGIEVFNKGNANNQKRLTPAVDAGYIELTNAQGYTLYRNVDKQATEAITANTGKLVYNYNLGTEGIDGVDGTTDPSGIDAEASIKNGARIVYKDSNNATNDFHQRRKSSLRE
ncbi:MAG: DUF4876 domain-containing protein [Prevotellaceae bacterium]|jgi:hypothetical protein|nr:DUF4876 domain-containing protein [Prevotellaceae bacterium]